MCIWQGIYKTGLGVNSARNYAWRNLVFVDRHVTYLAANANLYEEDMNHLMKASRQLKNKWGTTMPLLPTGNSGIGNRDDSWGNRGFVTENQIDELVARDVACDWIRNNKQRWRSWIPSICAAGSASDGTLKTCVPCEPGFFCEGGTNAASSCPAGSYCPINSSVPAICSSQRSSLLGSSTESHCNLCLHSRVLFQGKCVPDVALISAIVFPVLGLVLLVVVMYLWWDKQQKGSAHLIQADDIDFGILPRQLSTTTLRATKSHGRVYMATYQGTTVAVKVRVCACTFVFACERAYVCVCLYMRTI